MEDLEAKKRAMESTEKLVEIKETIEKGEAPSSEQIKYFLKEGEEAMEEAMEQMPESEGKKVVEQTQQVLGSMKLFLDCRNQDEILQRIGMKAARLLKEAASTDKSLTREERRKAKQLIEDTRELLRNLVVSGNLRRTLLSFLSLLPDLVSTTQETVEESKEEETEGMEPSEKLQHGLEKAEETLEKTKEKSGDRVKDFEDKLNSLLKEVSKNDSFKKFLRHFYSIIDYARTHHRAFDPANLHKTTLEKYFLELMSDVRSFLEQFSSPETLEEVQKNTNEFLRLMTEDESLKKLGREWREYLDRILDHPDLIGTEENKAQQKKLLEKTKEVLRQEKISKPLDSMVHSWEKLINDIQNDPVRVKLEQDLRSLFSEMMLDEYGNFALNDKALTELRKVIVPALVQQLKYIAIPKITSRSDTQEFTMHDIFISVPDLVPDKIHIDTRTTATFDTKQVGIEESHTKLVITLSDIEIHIRNARVHFKRWAFPKIEDNLIVNTDIYGSNTRVTIVLLFDKVTDDKGQSRLQFTKADVQVKLDNLRIKAVEGKHDILMNVLTTILNPLIKSRVEKEMAERIKDTMERIFGVLNDVSAKQISGKPSTFSKIQSTFETISSEMKPSAH